MCVLSSYRAHHRRSRRRPRSLHSLSLLVVVLITISPLLFACFIMVASSHSLSTLFVCTVVLLIHCTTGSPAATAMPLAHLTRHFLLLLAWCVVRRQRQRQMSNLAVIFLLLKSCTAALLSHSLLIRDATSLLNWQMH